MQTLLPLPVVPGNEAVRHLGEVGDDRLAVNVFAQRQRKFGRRALPVVGFQDFAQGDLHLGRVGDLDPHRVLARNRREDVDPLRASGAGDVALEAGDSVHPHSAVGIYLKARDCRPAGNVARLGADAEMRQRLDDDALNRTQLVVIGRATSRLVQRVQQVD